MAISMTLDLWLTNGWLRRHETSASEIAELLAVAERNLADAAIELLSPDARVGLAYAASLASASAALAATGHRPERERHHERLIDSLAHTIGADSRMVGRLHRQRKARNTMTYERVGTVSEAESWEALELALALTEAVRTWLKAHYSALLAEAGE